MKHEYYIRKLDNQMVRVVKQTIGRGRILRWCILEGGYKMTAPMPYMKILYKHIYNSSEGEFTFCCEQIQFTHKYKPVDPKILTPLWKVLNG